MLRICVSAPSMRICEGTSRVCRFPRRGGGGGGGGGGVGGGGGGGGGGEGCHLYLLSSLDIEVVVWVVSEEENNEGQLSVFLSCLFTLVMGRNCAVRKAAVMVEVGEEWKLFIPAAK